MVKKQLHPAGNGVECVKCASKQTVVIVNLVKIWSNLVELAGRNNAVKKESMSRTATFV